MTTKETKGYTKSRVGQLDWYKLMTTPDSIFKDKNEPFEAWFARKIEEQFPHTKDIAGGMDERGMSGNGDTQSPKPLA